MLIKEKLSIAEFADRFLGMNDFETPKIVNIEDLNIKILSDKNGKKCYKPLTHFVVKPTVKDHFTDGKIKVSKGHCFIENGENILAENHKDFKRVNEQMRVVDVTVGDTHCYYANGRLNHNTPASGGMAAQFYCHIQVRLNQIGKIKNKDGLVVGAKNRAVVRKTRLGPPWRDAEYETYFDSGIDDKKSCLEKLEKYKVIKGGAWKAWKEPFEKNFEGLDIDYSTKFQISDWRTWMENEEFNAFVSNKIAELSISKYKGFMEKDDETELETTEEAIDTAEKEIEKSEEE